MMSGEDAWPTNESYCLSRSICRTSVPACHHDVRRGRL